MVVDVLLSDGLKLIDVVDPSAAAVVIPQWAASALASSIRSSGNFACEPSIV